MGKTKRFIAVIPARAGSKGLRGKNMAPLGGRPLVWWTIAAAFDANCFDKIVVTTDIKELQQGIGT